MEHLSERGVQIARWIATRRPRTYLVAGWIAFVLGCYPGYLTVDGILQLYTVRSGEFSDYAPVMSAVWSLLEYVLAGPFPMLALQSGLFLFGTAAILRTVVTPRAAALTASCVLLFPPVFAVMAVIWPEALMAGALVAATGSVLQDNPRWKAAAIGFAILACACRLEAAFALFPLALAVLREDRKLRRVGLALVVTLSIALVARVTDRLATVTDTYVWEQQLQLMDTVGTLRRAKISDEATLQSALEGMPIADPTKLRERITASRDALNFWPLVNGDNRIFDIVDSDDEAEATSAAWRRAITTYPGAYLTHRWAMTRGMLRPATTASIVYDQFGSPDLLAPLHHRATASDWVLGMQSVVRAFAATPLFRPWLYLVLAVVVIALARRWPLLRNLAIAGIVYELVMFFTAPIATYRYSHLLTSAVCIALAAIIVRARRAWRIAP